MQLKEINSRVPQDSVLGLVLYSADFSVALDTTTATYADDTATGGSQ